jgi:mannonate dehydratase
MKVVLRDLYWDIAKKVGTSIPDILLEFAKALGVWGFDIHHPELIPGWKGWKSNEYEIFLKKLRGKLQDYSLNINSTLLPSPKKFLMSHPDSEREINLFREMIKCLGEASIPIADLNLNLDIDTFQWHKLKVQKEGYKMSSFNLQDMINNPITVERDSVIDERLWERRVDFYKNIISFAEDYDVKLALHPPDPPVPDHLIPGRIGILEWKRLVSEVPSPYNGVKYCVGTRYETGVDIFEEIRYLSRNKKIFNVHFRNVRGTLPTSGAYDEVLLDDGDMNMFRVLKTLHETGYDGSICPDHTAEFRNDEPSRRIGRAYSVGYMKALLSLL